MATFDPTRPADAHGYVSPVIEGVPVFDQSCVFGLDDLDSRIPAVAGVIGADLALVAWQGGPVSPTAILTSAVSAALRELITDPAELQFVDLQVGARPELDAIRWAWHVIARGGLSPVITLGCRPDGGLQIGDPVEAWADYAVALDNLAAASQPEPIIVQRWTGWSDPIVIERRSEQRFEVRGPSQLELGSIFVDEYGGLDATGPGLDGRGPFRALADRFRARRFHATLTQNFELFSGPIRLHGLAGPNGLDAVTAIERLS